ncbi:MAG TPA: helix-turn-helix domain-containing protein, partial [Acidimicrobiia bacterium]
MSWQASAWAISQRLGRGKSTAKLILLVHCNHAHNDGTASWVSIDTAAADAECDRRTAQRAVAWLWRNGYMRLGDQELVSHLPPGRRPIVYDMAMSEERRHRWAAEASAA